MDDALRRPGLPLAGVVHRPQSERASHDRAARLAKQFDLVVHVDRPALHPPDRGAHWSDEEPAEPWPTGLQRRLTSGGLLADGGVCAC